MFILITNATVDRTESVTSSPTHGAMVLSSRLVFVAEAGRTFWQLSIDKYEVVCFQFSVTSEFTHGT